MRARDDAQRGCIELATCDRFAASERAAKLSRGKEGERPLSPQTAPGQARNKTMRQG